MHYTCIETDASIPSWDQAVADGIGLHCDSLRMDFVSMPPDAFQQLFQYGAPTPTSELKTMTRSSCDGRSVGITQRCVNRKMAQ